MQLHVHIKFSIGPLVLGTVDHRFSGNQLLGAILTPAIAVLKEKVPVLADVPVEEIETVLENVQVPTFVIFNQFGCLIETEPDDINQHTTQDPANPLAESKPIVTSVLANGNANQH